MKSVRIEVYYIPWDKIWRIIYNKKFVESQVEDEVYIKTTHQINDTIGPAIKSFIIREIEEGLTLGV